MENQCETFVKNVLKSEGHKIKRISSIGFPDFLVDNSFYVEVKNLNNPHKGSYNLSDYQEIRFKEMALPIKIYYVTPSKKIIIKDFVPIKNISGTKTINVSFEDREYEKLVKIKGKTSWREFILKKLGGRKNETGRTGRV